MTLVDSEKIIARLKEYRDEDDSTQYADMSEEAEYAILARGVVDDCIAIIKDEAAKEGTHNEK